MGLRREMPRVGRRSEIAVAQKAAPTVNACAPRSKPGALLAAIDAAAIAVRLVRPFSRLENNATGMLTSGGRAVICAVGAGLRRMIYRVACALVALVCGGGALGFGKVRAADLLTPSPDGQPPAVLPLPTPPPEAESFEARLGVFAHSVGASEAGGVDANVELLLPRLPNDLPEPYKFLVPRPQLGGMINTGGKTSYGYGGVVWTLNLAPQFFLEPMFGGAVHDGDTTALDPDRNMLGCRVLFHTGLSGGYRLTDRWTALLTWDHISNGHLCSHNAGLNDYGVKLGYSF